MRRLCERCGRPFEVKPSRVTAGRGKHCSRACAAAARQARWEADPTAHPRYKGDAASPHTGRAAAGKRYTVLGACEVCGLVPATDRHHKDRVPTHNQRENVVFVCTACHHRLHLKDECVRGHPMSGANLYVAPNGDRGCRACRALASRLYTRRLADRLVKEQQP